MSKSFAKQVARGAALLDEKVPGWREKIDRKALNLRFCSRCIIGQLFPEAEDFLRVPLNPDASWTWAEVEEHGFYTSVDGGFPQLTQEWLKELSKGETK